MFLGDVASLEFNHMVLVATFLWGQLFTEKEPKEIFSFFKPGDSSFTLKVRCCYSPISGLVW